MTPNKEIQIMLEIYRRLFKESSPSGDFDNMMAEGEKNEQGQIVIPFDNYHLSEEDQKMIIDSVLSSRKVLKYLKPSFRAAIALGCSPRYTKKPE